MLTYLIITLALALILLLADFSWSNTLSSDRNELVFESRNRSYGAYALRKSHPRIVLFALLLTSFLFAGSALWLMKTRQIPQITMFNDLVTMIDTVLPPPIDLPQKTADKTAGASGGAKSSSQVEHKTTYTVEASSGVVGPPDDPEDTPGGPAGPGVDPAGNGAQGGSGLLAAASDSTDVYEIVQEAPQFPGGEAKMLEWLARNMKPLEAPDFTEVKGTVWVTFVVSRTGEVTNAELTEGIKGHPSINQKAVKVVSAMPAWTPGKMNGRPVNVRCRVPFRIHLR